MPYTTEGKKRALNGLGITHASVHTSAGVPGDTGTNEVTGGSPAYARKPITIAAPSAGQEAMTGTLTFDIPAGTTCAYIGFFDSLTATGATRFVAYGIMPAAETFAAQGQLVVDTATLDMNS